jgi:FixJ family two-component response regulator
MTAAAARAAGLKAALVLPVILISGYAGSKEVPLSFPFLQKPFDSKAILEAVNRAIAALSESGARQASNVIGVIDESRIPRK